jgi:hypothetical protein
MLVPLAYTVAKRVFPMRGRTLRTFLTIHIYAALVGALLTLVHTGHKFDNPLGTLLTALMLIVVLSGFVGRYLLQESARHLGDKRRDLAAFSPAFEAARQRLAASEAPTPQSAQRALLLGLVWPWAVHDRELRSTASDALDIVDAMSALETSIALHDGMQRWFRLWMRFHLSLTTVFYLLLAAHVVIVAYYGLRWLPR